MWSLYLEDELNPLLPTNTLKNPCWRGGGQVVQCASSLLSSNLVYNLTKQINGIEKAHLKAPITPANRISTSAHFLTNMNWMGKLYLLIMNMM